MSTNQGKTPQGAGVPAAATTAITIGSVGAVILIFYGLISKFKELAAWTSNLKILAAGLAVITLVVSSIYIKRGEYRSGVVRMLIQIFIPGNTQAQATVPEISLRMIRLGAACFLALLGTAQGFAYFSAPTPLIGSQSLYYMLVMDASHKMETYFDSGTQWDAARTVALNFLDDANDHSNFGLVLVGGQNQSAETSDLCHSPSQAAIPMTSQNGFVLPSDKLLKGAVIEQIEAQSPAGGGSFSEAFSLATDQMQDLPPGVTRVLFFISGSSDDCEDENEWDALLRDIQFAEETGIKVHSEIIVLDETYNPSVEEFVQDLNKMQEASAQTGEASPVYVDVAHNEAELEQIIMRVIERLQIYIVQEVISQVTSTPLPPTLLSARFTEIVSGYRQPVTPVMKPTKQSLNPTTADIHASTTPTRATRPTRTHTITYTPTITFTPTDTCTFTPSPTTTFTLTSPPTLTLVPTLTIRPTLSEAPTRERKPTPNDPTPEPTSGGCNLSCGGSGATAICNDCTYSYAEHHSGACAGHDGVMQWCQ